VLAEDFLFFGVYVTETNIGYSIWTQTSRDLRLVIARDEVPRREVQEAPRRCPLERIAASHEYFPM
jgi:hypothetical protein